MLQKGSALYVPFGWVPLIVGVESYPDDTPSESLTETVTYPEPDNMLKDKAGFITFYVPVAPSVKQHEQAIAEDVSQVSDTIHAKPNALKPYTNDIKQFFSMCDPTNKPEKGAKDLD